VTNAFVHNLAPSIAAERAAAHRWQLSEREREIVAMLDAREATA
jgi:hypothetical protein